MKDIFLTATWRKEWNKEFNPKLEQTLLEKGITCYLPQRDTDQSGTRQNIFLEDIAGIDQANVVVAMGANNAQSSNWGLEIGYAYATQKPVIILTDEQSPPDLMPEGAAAHILVPSDMNDISSYIDELVAVIKQVQVDA